MSLLMQVLLNGVQLGSIYALIALGYTMVYGVLRLINFAHGDVFMVGAYVGLFVVNAALVHGHPSWWLAVIALLASMSVCGVLGVVIERFAYRPVRKAPRLTPLITAIGVSLLLENVAVLPQVFGAQARFYPAVVPNDTQTLHLGSVTIVRNDLILFAATLALMLVLAYVVKQTRVGKAMRAVSEDKDAASLMGIDIDRIISFTFFVGSAMAGAGGFLFAGLTHNQVYPYMGIMPGIKAFVAAVLGGIGNIPGAALGGLIMGLSEALVAGYGPSIGVPATYSDAVAFLVLIVVLLIRPSGILGKGGTQKV